MLTYNCFNRHFDSEKEKINWVEIRLQCSSVGIIKKEF